MKGLCYLHLFGLNHGNLVSSNVMVDSEGTIKISDSVGTGAFIQKHGLKNLQSVNLMYSSQGFAGEITGNCLYEQKMINDRMGIGYLLYEMLTSEYINDQNEHF
jgi:serine/threonine protein kinase